MRVLTEVQAKVLMVIGSSRDPVHPVTISRRTGIKVSVVELTCEWAAQTKPVTSGLSPNARAILGEQSGERLAYLIENSYYGHYNTVCQYVMDCDKMRDGA